MKVDGLIDTHCHLDAAEFDPDREAQRLLARVLGVTQCVIPAVTRAHWAGVRELAHRHQDRYAWGIHPLYVMQADASDAAALRDALVRAIDDPALVAVGEIGLDGFDGHPDMDRQLFWFRQQLAIARELGLPVILHVRRAVDAVLRELRRCPVPGGIAHAFNGSLQQARAFVDLGFRLGFGGALTYERAQQIRRLAATLPLSALVLETDAPDIPPHWIYQTAQARAQGLAQGRNEPAHLPAIGAVLASLRGLAPEEIAAATRANAIAALPRLAIIPRS